jgi:hypothetical protein
MGKWASRVCLAGYAIALAIVCLRAWAKWGLPWGGWFLVLGLAFLIVFWRIWLMVRYIVFGGRRPWTLMSQGTEFLPPTRKAPPRP